MGVESQVIDTHGFDTYLKIRPLQAYPKGVGENAAEIVKFRADNAAADIRSLNGGGIPPGLGLEDTISYYVFPNGKFDGASSDFEDPSSVWFGAGSDNDTKGIEKRQIQVNDILLRHHLLLRTPEDPSSRAYKEELKAALKDLEEMQSNGNGPKETVVFQATPQLA